MSAAALVHLVVIMGLLAVLVPMTGRYLAAVFGGDKAPGDRQFDVVDRFVYRACGIDAPSEQRWTGYLRSLLAFSVVGFGLLYLILRLQGNPVDLGAVPAALAFNTAVSFVSNTNWQAYGGEATLSHFTQMVGLTVQNFVSAAAGMAVPLHRTMRTRPGTPSDRSVVTRVLAGGAAVAILAGCTSADRPTFSDWNPRWDEAQLLVPTEQELVDGGRAHCDQLLVRLRTELTDLTPAPSESIDPAIDEWSNQVRTLAFECPTDPTEVDQALSTIHELEAEIAAVEP